MTDSIKVNKANAVVLGIGMATLISTTGKPCIEVADVDGVGSDVPRDDRIRAYDGTVSYGNAGENRRTRADPDVVSDGNTALRSDVRREFGKQLLKRVHRCIRRIVIQASQDLDAARDGAELADRDLNPFTSSGL